MTGVIDVGGGMRGIYAAGIFDYCLEKGIAFDKCIGISAGSANLASFLAGQKGRNYRFYTDYSFRDEYMGMENFVKNGSFFNFDYIYDDLSGEGGEDPLDFDAMISNPSEFVVIATDAEEGKPRYFDKKDIKALGCDVFKASCCIPGINKPVYIEGRPYFDGAVSDCIPIKKALAMGCDKVVLILTKPVDYIRKPGKDVALSKMIEREFPETARKFCDRADMYNLYVKLALEKQEEGNLLILAPDDITGVDTLKRDKEALKRLYCKGMADAVLIENFLNKKE